MRNKVYALMQVLAAPKLVSPKLSQIEDMYFSERIDTYLGGIALAKITEWSAGRVTHDR